MLKDRLSQHYKDGFEYLLNVNKLGLPNISGIIDPLDIGDGDIGMIVITVLDVVNVSESIKSFATDLWLNQ